MLLEFIGLCAHVCMHACVCYSTCVIRGQHADGDSILLPCGSREMNSGHQFWLLASLHTEPLFLPSMFFSRTIISRKTVCCGKSSGTLHFRLTSLLLASWDHTEAYFLIVIYDLTLQ